MTENQSQRKPELVQKACSTIKSIKKVICAEKHTHVQSKHTSSMEKKRIHSLNAGYLSPKLVDIFQAAFCTWMHFDRRVRIKQVYFYFKISNQSIEHQKNEQFQIKMSDSYEERPES